MSARLRIPRIGLEIGDRADRDWVTPSELATEAGLTYRQLDYWTRTHVIEPIDLDITGTGTTRRFHADQVTRARTIRQLLDAGWSLEFCRTWIDQLLVDGRVDVGPITVTVHQPGDAA